MNVTFKFTLKSIFPWILSQNHVLFSYSFLALHFSSVSLIRYYSYAAVPVFTCLSTIPTVLYCIVHLYRVAAKQRFVYFISSLMYGARISHIHRVLDKYTDTDYAVSLRLYCIVWLSVCAE